MGLLRALLAISVVLAHTRTPGLWGLTMAGGEIAVQCFYIVSGFFITLILNEKYVAKSDNRVFYLNRAIRIYSLYFICFAGYLLVDIAGLLAVHKGTIATWLSARSLLGIPGQILLSLSNLLLIGLDWTSFLAIGKQGLHLTADFHNSSPHVYDFILIPQAWTLGLELVFYILAPFIVRRSFTWIAIAFAAILGLRAVFYVLGSRHDPWSYRFFPFELALFLAGSLAYKGYAKIRDRRIPVPLQVLAFSPLILIVGYQAFGSPEDVFFTPSRLFLLGATAVSLPLLFLVTKSHRIDRFVGELSYPIYLIHVAILRVGGNLHALANGRTEISKLLLLFAFGCRRGLYRDPDRSCQAKDRQDAHRPWWQLSEA